MQNKVIVEVRMIAKWVEDASNGSRMAIDRKS
jgi:hypothetical protein